MTSYRFSAVIERDEDGYFAYCPQLQGCYTQGETLPDVLYRRCHTSSRRRSFGLGGLVRPQVELMAAGTAAEPPLPLGEGWGEGVVTDYRAGRRGIERIGAVRGLRRDSTDAERKLWALLRSRQFAGAKFRRQHEFGPYILDFYCPDQRIVIEADGGQHYEEEGLTADEQRTKYLQSRGIHVLRFTNLEILLEPEGVADRIQQALEKRPHPNPLPEGEGIEVR